MMADAIIYALVFSAALDSDDQLSRPIHNGKGNNLQLGRFGAHVIALKFVSDSDATVGKQVDEAAESFMADESGLTLLSGTQASAEEILQFVEQASSSFHVSQSSDTDFQDFRSKTPIFTAEPSLRRAMRDGLDAVRILLTEKIQSFEDRLGKQLKASVETELP